MGGAVAAGALWVLAAVAGVALSIGFELVATKLAHVGGIVLRPPWPDYIGVGCSVLVCLAALAGLRLVDDRSAARSPRSPRHRRRRRP